MKFAAYERTLQGTGASRRLRNAHKVPGIVYGAGEPRMIELDHNALFHALKKETFHSSILEMELAGNTQKVLLRDFHMHSWKPIVMHVDFQRVDDTTRLRKKVPLHFVNEENSPAVKTDKCLVSHVSTDVEIECLATQLPEFITVDLGEVVKGATLTTADLQLPKGVKVVKHGSKNPVIASVVLPLVEEEAPAAEAAAAAVAPAAAPAKGSKAPAAAGKAAPAAKAAAPAAPAKKK
jgi:large subunit ribosomal protein L25